MLKYCVSCVMPHTKPHLTIDEEGVCDGCRTFMARGAVDWDKKKEEFLSIVDKLRSKDGSRWDCIVPSSGGKDSTYQTLRLLQLGLNPLCVTSTTCDLSEIGRKNIENLKNLGVDTIEVSPNAVVRKKLNRIGLTQIGDISWPEHYGIETIPVRVAVQYEVPLIVWGENSQHEYGGPTAGSDSNTNSMSWLMQFAMFAGLRVSDVIGHEGITEKDMILYKYPSDEDLQRVGVTGIFLGQYLPWDGYSNALLAQAYGFTTFHTTVEGSIVNYENVDNHQTGIHDYFKFLKFGFGRATDISCLHLRRGRIFRQDALELVRIHDGKFPWTCLGKPLKDILDPLEITVDKFIEICDRFTNKKLFLTDGKGQLIKDKNGNLTKTNYDN